MSNAIPDDLTALTVDLLSAYLAHNQVLREDLPALIASTRQALATSVGLAEKAVPIAYKAAVSVQKSIASPDHLISLIDGKPYKTLKRHLAKHGLSPAEYRERYKLPRKYPMVAATYSAMRREAAKRLGLGRKPKSAATQSAPPADALAVDSDVQKK